jgi:Kef-type K+ transport system membrane component KefB/nucleotide-binding universal stress UspA family protein
MPSRLFIFLLALSLLLVPSALAAETQGGPSEVVFISQIVVLLIVGRLLGEFMQRIGQPSVIGQLIAGILLGPSLLGAIWPEAQHVIFPPAPEQKSMIAAVSQLGILMLLLVTGMETDLKLVKKVGRAAFSVSVAGIVLPFVCGFALGEMLPDALLAKPEQRLITSLFLGTALAISSVKIVAMVVREMNFMRRNVGQVIVASAIIDDTIGWIIIAITFSLALHGAVDALAIAQSVLGTGLFLAVSFTIGRPVVFALIRWANDTFISEMPVITTILVVMAVMALTTHLIGVHTVLGAFVAGILVGESPILTRHINEQLRGLIVALFMPVFFGLAGLSTDLTILKDPHLILLTLGLILIASLGKFTGAFIGGTLGGLTRRESLALACGMNARGSTEVIVASIGLSMGALSQDLFTMIVAMAVVTTMAMPPMLRWALARLPLSRAEKVRLEREEFEEKGFVANIERLLLAVDGSTNGRFASRLAGLLAGARGMPTTILHVGADDVAAESRARKPEGAAATVRAAAEASKSRDASGEPAKPAKVAVTTRVSEASAEEAVASEAKKGYGLMMIGVEKTAGSKGGFHPDVARVALGFEGPLAVVAAQGLHLDQPLESSLKILVPVSGTEVSRRAAEVAFVLAHAYNCPVAALYVASARQTKATGLRLGAASAIRRQEEAILKDIAEIADRFDVPVRTAMRAGVTAEDAIAKEARAGGYNLIVIGVNRRPGETLFFGTVAAHLLEDSEQSLLFVSS